MVSDVRVRVVPSIFRTTLVSVALSNTAAEGMIGCAGTYIGCNLIWQDCKLYDAHHDASKQATSAVS